MGMVVEQAANEAPYKIFALGGGRYAVKNNAGQTKATFNSRAAARQYQQALYTNVPGASRKAARTPWTGTAPLPPKAK